MTAKSPPVANLIDQKSDQLQEDVAKFLGIISSILLQLQVDVDDPNTPAPSPALIELGDILIDARFSGKEFLRNLNKLSEMRENVR